MPRLAAPLLLALLLAGCAALPVGTPAERARRALDGFAQELGPHGAALSSLAGSVSANGYSAPFRYGFARDGTRHFNLTVGPVAFDVHCQGDRVVRIVGGVPTEDRPGACPLDASRYGAPLALLDQTSLTSAQGSGNDVIATFNGTNASVGGIVIRADVHDRVTRLELRSPGGDLTANATYGRRADFHLPVAAQRAALGARNHTCLSDGNLTWEAEDVTGNASLSDLEVRVLNGTTRERVATFRMAGGPQSAGGFSFTFADKDGDGSFSRRDAFWLARPGWQREGDYDVQVWDAWADAPVVRQQAVPGADGATLALAMAGAALLYGSMPARSPRSFQRG